MRFPRGLFALMVLGVCVLSAHEAQAAKPLPGRRFRTVTVNPPSVNSSSFHPSGTPTPNCDIGMLADPNDPDPYSYPIDFIFPPDDIYYIFYDLRDCPTCVTADSAYISQVHLVLQMNGPCELPIAIGLNGMTQLTEACPTPNLTDVIRGLEPFLLPASTGALPDTVEFVLTLSGPALVPRRGFITVSFVDSVIECSDPNTTKPYIVVEDNLCRQCKTYNDWFGDEIPDDLCFPDAVGNPLIWTEIDSCFPLFDTVAPSRVVDLGVDSTGFNGLRLVWTGAGDDTTLGTPTWYELRRSTSPIDSLNFAFADSVPTALPHVASTPETLLVTGLNENTLYYFAMRVHDEGGNVSPLSNVLAAATSGGPPSAVQNLEVVSDTDQSIRLAWTAVGDDGDVGRPLRYLVAVSTGPVNAGNFDATLRDSMPATVDAGNTEVYEVLGLASATTYNFGIRARDDAGNLSVLTTISGRTEPGGPLNGHVAPAIAARLQPSRLVVDLYWLGVSGGDANQSIRIFDMAGRMVRTLRLASVASGRELWDGLDDDGAGVPPGMYIARLSTGSKEAATRIVLLK